MDTWLQKYYSRLFWSNGISRDAYFLSLPFKDFTKKKKNLTLYNRKKCFDVKGNTAKIWRVGRSLFMIF